MAEEDRGQGRRPVLALRLGRARRQGVPERESRNTFKGESRKRGFGIFAAIWMNTRDQSRECFNAALVVRFVWQDGVHKDYNSHEFNVIDLIGRKILRLKRFSLRLDELLRKMTKPLLRL